MLPDISYSNDRFKIIIIPRYNDQAIAIELFDDARIAIDANAIMPHQAPGTAIMYPAGRSSFFLDIIERVILVELDEPPVGRGIPEEAREVFFRSAADLHGKMAELVSACKVFFVNSGFTAGFM